ncbi:MAG: sigma-54-dependent Fis family transcriptional regulator [Bacteroidetes bacterium]|nr:sigma-54-dependent Fis family transcriptional regulator [Bacteroidota bacterium]
MKQGKLLIADDNKKILNALNLFLQFEFEVVQTISSPNRLINELKLTNYDVVLLDMNFTAGVNTGNEGLYWLKEIKKQFPEVEVIMFTAYGDVELAVKALKEGATDFVLKPWENEKLKATLKAAYRLRKSSAEIVDLKTREQSIKRELNQGSGLIIGKSHAMQGIMQLVNKVSKTDANILITGENGTGKELIAKEIHRLSERNKELFVMVDLSSLTETLFESELFGHKKGAFTNALEDRTGKFVLASKGTLFLDEIGNIPLHLQSKLLTVLQTRIVTPVGSNKEQPFNIRLICATNKNLQQMVADGQFRQDLLYRINTITIPLPSLRERVDDIEDIANFYLNIYGKKYNKSALQLAPSAIEKLKSNTWPGNIRELQHTIEKAVILSDENMLTANDFVFGYDPNDFSHHDETLDEMEKKMIISALNRHGQNMTAVANQLGITRPTLYNKVKKYGI